MIGRVLGRYRVESLLGRGGMGEVYLAVDERLHRQVAVKVLPADSLSDETARRRFRHEALAISRLNHPNIATVHDFDTFDGTDALVMEYVPGHTLGELIAQGQPPLERALDLGAQMARGLAAAHRQGVVHRDLKPNNVRVTDDGQVKILDFGLALRLRADTTRSRLDELTGSATTGGTPSYMSPEQIRGEVETPASDLFSLGLVLYELITGRHPFAATHQAAVLYRIANDEPEPPSRARPGVPPELDDLILRLLAKSPERRFSSADEVAAALSSPRHSAPATDHRRGARRFVWQALAAAGVLLVGWVLAEILRPGEVYSSRSAEGTLRQLTFTGDAGVPCWSPDGRHIAFMRGDGQGLYVMPATGGAARKLECDILGLVPWGWTSDGNGVLAHGVAPGQSHPQIVRLDLYGGPSRILAENAYFPAQSPDGRTLAYVNSRDRTVSLMDLQNGSTSVLVSPEDEGIAVYKPKWLPDGQSLTYMRWSGGPGHEIWVIGRDGTGKRQVETGAIQIAGQYAISRDGRSAYIGGELTGVWYIWRLSLTGGEHERLTGGGEHDCHVGLSPDDSRFVFGRDTDLSRITILDVASGAASQPVEMSVGTGHAVFAPDGNSLYLQALVNGRWQVWEAALDGSRRLAPVLADAATSFMAPAMSGDAICHIRSEVGQVHVWGAIKWSQSLWVCAVDGGRARKVTGDDMRVSRLAPSVGPAGQFLYCGYVTTEKGGAGEALCFQNGSSPPREIFRDSPDAELIAFDWGPRDGAAVALLRDLKGGGEQVVATIDLVTGARETLVKRPELLSALNLAGPGALTAVGMAPDRHRVAIVLRTRDGEAGVVTHVATYDLKTHAALSVHVFGKEQTVGHVVWSPDGRRLAVDAADSKSDVYLWEPEPPPRVAVR